MQQSYSSDVYFFIVEKARGVFSYIQKKLFFLQILAMIALFLFCFPFFFPLFILPAVGTPPMVMCLSQVRIREDWRKKGHLAIKALPFAITWFLDYDWCH